MEVRKHMRRKITMLIMAAMLALTMSFGGAGAAFAVASCEDNPNGCAPGQEREAKDAGESDDFVVEETHRGKGVAKGTPRETTCYLPSGNEVSCDHPQFSS
jgi:hypothetical protein